MYLLYRVVSASGVDWEVQPAFEADWLIASTGCTEHAQVLHRMCMGVCI